MRELETLLKLAGLDAMGLVTISTEGPRPPCCADAPRSTELAEIVDAVADVFGKRRSTVIRLIFGDVDQDVLRTSCSRQGPRVRRAADVFHPVIQLTSHRRCHAR